MATTVGIQLDLYSQASGTFLLWLRNEGVLLNAGGDTLTEDGTTGYFEATVAETVDSSVAYNAAVTRDGVVVYAGWLSTDISNQVDEPGSLQLASVLSLVNSGPITTQSPVSTAGNITIVRNDSYDGTANPKLTWTVTKDFTAWTGLLTIRHRQTRVELLQVTATAVSATSVEASLATTDTAMPLGSHLFDLQFTSGASVQTPLIGTAHVIEDYTTA